jgi:hypothetical protein
VLEEEEEELEEEEEEETRAVETDEDDEAEDDENEGALVRAFCGSCVGCWLFDACSLLSNRLAKYVI